MFPVGWEGVVLVFRKPYVILLFVLSLSIFTASSLAQSFPVYVSAGPTIYAIKNGNASVVATQSGANFESLAVGPDSADLDGAGNAQHPFLLYACDTANNAIYRLDPAAPAIGPQLVFSDPMGPLTPECARFSAKGDLYVTNRSGAGLYLINCPVSPCTESPIANIPFTGSKIVGTTAMQVNSSDPTSGRGITQKYSGDLLAVDNAANSVLRFSYPLFDTNTVFANSKLGAPIGLARISNGDVFVSNSNLGNGKTALPPVSHFAPTGAIAASCPGLAFPHNTQQIPGYLATASIATTANTVVNDTIYLVANTNNSGTLYSWTNTTGAVCTLTSIASVNAPLSGVAVAPAGAGPAAPPAVTLSLPVRSSNANPTATVFNFNSSEFQLVATGCTAQVTAYPFSPATVQQMISRAQFLNPANPSVNLGEDGYQIIYVGHWIFNTNPPPSCTPVGGGDFVAYIASFVDSSQFNNPRILQCDNTDPSTEPTLNSTACAPDQMLAVYPVGGPIPADATAGSTTRTTNSVFALVNEGSQATQAQPPQFCGFQSPLTNPPSPPATFSASSTNTIPVKFKLAQAGGDCQNGRYVTNAEALLSVARIFDSNGAVVFNPVNVNPTASSIDVPPLFNAGNQQYSFTLNIKNLAAGTYSLTVTFLTDDTTNAQTFFKIQ